MHDRIKTIMYICIVSILFSSPTSAIKSPDKYGENECELAAKDYQAEYGGSLIFIQPVKYSGAWNLGPYNGHFLNIAWSKERGTYYVDYQSQNYFKTEEEVLDRYYMTKGQKGIAFNVNKEHPPFPMIWHY